MFPLGTALLPGEVLPLRIFEPRYRQMLGDVLDADRGFGIVLIARGHEVGGGDVRTDIGTFAQIDEVERAPDGRAALMCTGSERFRVVEWLPDDPYPRAVVETLPEPAGEAADDVRLTELRDALTSFVDEVATRRPAAIADGLPVFDTTDLFAHGVFGWATRLPIGAADRQKLLECTTVAAQVGVLHEVVAGLSDMIRFGL
ncbi:LON peptidase substrate-binding domain-containing protein [Gordonia sp. CPCC 206044]|uniref:LON peptidase substrate-binding domain-containing protein n=1 Tax=Gordonia sp. CPCC 206044 TaxID=3140793 RepID=UPI003AF3E7FF